MKKNGIVILFVSAIICCLTGCGEKKIDNTAENQRENFEKYIPYFSSEPTDSETNLECTYVEYGSYPKTRLKKDEITDEIVNGVYDKDENMEINGKEIHREIINDENYYYYVEPIKWIILDVVNGEAILWAEEIIDSTAFSNTESDVYSWKDSALREWLNGSFYKNAFSDQEQELLISKDYSNYHSSLGSPKKAEKYPEMLINTTNDKVCIQDAYDLSWLLYNCPYIVKTTGKKMTQKINFDDIMKCDTSDYAFDRYKEWYASWKGKRYSVDYVIYYWTRTPLDNTDEIVYVFSDWGHLGYTENTEYNEGHCQMGVRPMIVLPVDKIGNYIIE